MTPTQEPSASPVHEPSPEQPSPDPSRWQGKRVTAKLPANVRSAPNSTASLVRTLPEGLPVRVFARGAGWVQVGDDKPWGWVFSGLVTLP
ncbi:MAG: SH3 domain-containing protein [Sinobacteraceae bacterium]|nr:SH3 domain-containing protein [Nevskiaceae bacterium]